MSDPKKQIADIVAAAEALPPLELVRSSDKPKRERKKRAPKAVDAGGSAPPPPDDAPPLGEPDDGGDRIPPEIIEACALEPPNDVGNGKRLLLNFGSEILHVRDVGWHWWTGKYWSKEGGDEAVTRYAQLTAARIATERTALTLTVFEQKAVEAGEQAVIDLKALAASVLERSEDDYREEKARLSGLIADGLGAKRALGSRKGALAKFAIQSGNTAKINGMIAQALPHRTVAVVDLDKDPYSFNVENGTLRFFYGIDPSPAEYDDDVVPLKWQVRLDPHDRADMITKCAPVAYDRLAACAEWDKFLDRVQPLERLRLFLRDFHGYGLTGSNAIQGLVFNTGGGANGKSTFIEALMRLFGAYGDLLNPESFTGQQQRQGNQATPDIADLPGVRLLRVSELPEKAKLQEPLVKALTGGEPMKARHNYGIRFFLFYPQFKVSMSGNAKPDINDISEGMWRRLMFVPWTVMIPKDERLPFEEMQRLFESERPGILNWLVDGCLAFLNAGCKLDVPPEVMAATEAHRDDMDPIGQFLEACVYRKEGCKVGGGLLYRTYQAWCDLSGLTPLHNTTFGKTVPKKGWVKVKEGNVKYLDMAIAESAPPPREDPATRRTPRDPPFGEPI